MCIAMSWERCAFGLLRAIVSMLSTQPDVVNSIDLICRAADFNPHCVCYIKLGNIGWVVCIPHHVGCSSMLLRMEILSLRLSSVLQLAV